ncbi:PKD domain-containing protein [Phytohabitans sp. LJ34]|uniref:PKD domain-containing protein n=1 Tax=Phytohabitans sp. LJ34 TaxID=3452217 RepID=UPI003F887A8A
MRLSLRAGITALALTGGTLVGAAAPAEAAVTTLYVRQASSTCSDSGAGTSQQPFCTIGAAAAVVAAGQTVDIGAGRYAERVTVATSGAPGEPITFQAQLFAGVHMSGPTAGFVIDGQHDLRIRNIETYGTRDVPVLDIRDSSAITVEGGNLTVDDATTVPPVRLAGVTNSRLRNITVNGRMAGGGVSLDAATSGVTVDHLELSQPGSGPITGAVGIDVAGPANTIVNNFVIGFTGAAIAIESGAVDTVVANNLVQFGSTYGIHNRGATGTAITNNSVTAYCRGGIRVDGASSGVSVQNNVLQLNFNYGQSQCAGVPTDGFEIGVFDGAVGRTTVDYNNANHGDSEAKSPRIYAWNGTRMSMAAFRTASGQAAHDKETMGQTRDNTDSANSAAPGYRATDMAGRARIDDPAMPNVGTGPVAYADRGAVENIRVPVVWSDTTLNVATRTVTVDASATQPGIAPIASYEFRLGDGSVVTQTSPVITHTYAQTGRYSIVIKVTDTDGRSGQMDTSISMLPVIGSFGLLSLYNHKYVATNTEYPTLEPSQAGVTAAGHFDLVDAGQADVALFARSLGRYVTTGLTDTDPLGITQVAIGERERFALIRNADGSISLRSKYNGRYVSLQPAFTPFLIASRTAIGTWEKFHQVRLTDAARTLKAHANGNFVSAESAGTKPLIASRPAANTWERFDIVDLGNGQIALFARANNRFVSAESAGTQPLLAGRVAVGGWERFTMVQNSDGSVSLKAVVNDRYVAAEGAGTKPLLAGRTAIGTWERFTLG